MPKCGIIIFNEQKEIYFLFRIRPYSRCIVKPRLYVEKYCIPRGKKKEFENDLQCAAREFIEETGFFFNRITILPNVFTLTWDDPPGHEWKYTILFGVVKSHERILIDLNKTDISRMLSIFNEDKNFKEYTNLKMLLDPREPKRRKIHSEFVTPMIDSFETFKKIITVNLPLYGRENYTELFILLGRLIEFNYNTYK